MTTKKSTAAKQGTGTRRTGSASKTSAPAKQGMTASRAGKKATGTKAAAKKSAASKPVKKASVKKAPAKKATAKRKYSPGAGAEVEQEMREMHEGKLRSGSSGKKVTDPKQAIAIGLAKARRAGEKVPPNPNDPS